MPDPSQDANALRGVVFCARSPHLCTTVKIAGSTTHLCTSSLCCPAQHLCMLCCRTGIRLVAVQYERLLLAPQSRDVGKAAAMLRSSNRHRSDLPGDDHSTTGLLPLEAWRVSAVISLWSARLPLRIMLQAAPPDAPQQGVRRRFALHQCTSCIQYDTVDMQSCSGSQVAT